MTRKKRMGASKKRTTSGRRKRRTRSVARKSEGRAPVKWGPVPDHASTISDGLEMPGMPRTTVEPDDAF